jgi:hypothetical protein
LCSSFPPQSIISNAATSIKRRRFSQTKAMMANTASSLQDKPFPCTTLQNIKLNTFHPTSNITLNHMQHTSISNTTSTVPHVLLFIHHLRKSLRDSEPRPRLSSATVTGGNPFSTTVTSLHHHNQHHDPHTEGISKETEASDGGGSKAQRKKEKKKPFVLALPTLFRKTYVIRLPLVQQ